MDRITDLLVSAMATERGERWLLVRQAVEVLYRAAVRDAQAGEP